MAENTGQGAAQAMVYEGDVDTGTAASGAAGAGTTGRGARATRKSTGGTATSRRGGRSSTAPPQDASELANPQLRKDLRDFASGRPNGWDHEDWITFLESLRDRGHDIRDRDAIGVALEKERLDLVLSSIRGLGPQRRRALVDRYGTVWTLRAADPNEIAAVAKIPVELARTAREATI